MGAACSKTNDPSHELNNPVNMKIKTKSVTFAEPITQMEPVVPKSPVKEVKRKDSSSSSSSDEDKRQKKHQKEATHETPATEAVIQIITPTPIETVEPVHIEDVSIKLVAAPFIETVEQHLEE